MSRTVSATITLSLDGYAADPGGDMSWLVESAVHEQSASGFAGFCAGIDTVSRTLEEATWQHSRVVRDLETTVRELRAGPGRGVLVSDSVSVIRALLTTELLDELRITHVPAILGAGLRLFDGPLPASTWTLESVATIPTGATVTHHRRR
ncbi:MAG: deaminase [Actinomycetospora sp.]|nr:deaminase [Actinomycetospora sp.]